MQCNAMHVKGQYSDWAESEKEVFSSIEDDGGRSAPPPLGCIGLILRISLPHALIHIFSDSQIQI